MSFFVVLALINLACFLPLYLLNVREAPNPFVFWQEAVTTSWRWPLELAYIRLCSPDPFRIHFDFTLVALLAVGTGATGPTAQFAITGVLAVGFVEILYSSVMHSIFKRPPALKSDLALLKAGVALAQRQAYWMAALAVAALILIWLAAAWATSTLFQATPPAPWLAFTAAAVLVPPCLYHFADHYTSYMWRTVYSPTLHLASNLREEASVAQVNLRETSYYERFNRYRGMTLSGAPNVVIVAIESYGSIVYRSPDPNEGIRELTRSMERELGDLGYRFASTFSEAPLFAGGSWLSYASFLYGARIDSLQLYDNLFTRAGNFSAYESLLHILRRNGFENVLLCPLGGVDTHAVDWTSLDRCFQAQRRIEFEDLRYRGARVNYFGAVRRYAPLDQYSLNFGYEDAMSRGGPFSLFFCTLNSHYPWHSGAEATDDWRGLNAGGEAPPTQEGPTHERYASAIHYQLDYLLRFARDRADDAPLIILFGDHQPPMITPESMGLETPVHVLSRNHELIDVFLEHGFSDSIDLTGKRPRGIRHEAFLSLMARGLQAAYGTEPGLDISYQEKGSSVLTEALSGAGATG